MVISKYGISINNSISPSTCLVRDGEILYYCEEEKITKTKNETLAIRSLLVLIEQLNSLPEEILISGLDHENVLIPPHNKSLYETFLLKFFKPPIVLGHLTHLNHLTHAFSSFYNSGLSESSVLIVNEGGSYQDFQSPPTLSKGGFELESIFTFKHPNTLNVIWQSLSALDKKTNKNKTQECLPGGGIVQIYEAISKYLGFNLDKFEKTSILSTYGKPNSKLPPLLINNRGNQNLFNLECHRENKTKDTSNFISKNKPDVYFDHSSPKKTSQFQKDLAFLTQKTTQEYLGNLIEKTISLTNQNNICLGGSCFLNPITNSYIKKRFPQINLYFNPVPCYAGTSIGTAKHYWYLYNDSNPPTPFKSPYLGPFQDLNYIESYINSLPNTYKVTTTTPSKIALLLKNNNSIALFQGRAEATKQALGNRSILHNPNDLKGKNKINKIKQKKEWFMPYPATILEEESSNWFDMMGLKSSPFMMFVMDVLPKKLKSLKSVVNVDNTCRVQTINEEQNPHYYKLIQEFKKLTNIPLLLNTSLNISGKPIIEDIIDVFEMMDENNLKYLYLPELGKLIKKSNG